jgi:hypothetical protein
LARSTHRARGRAGASWGTRAPEPTHVMGFRVSSPARTRARARHGVRRASVRVPSRALPRTRALVMEYDRIVRDEAPYDRRLAHYLAAQGMTPLYIAVHGWDLSDPEIVRSLRRSFGMSIPRDFRPRCGARTRSGAACRAPVVWDHDHNRPRTKCGRCKLHGGLSTGPRTEAGKARSRAALDRVNAARRGEEPEPATAA